MKKFIILSVLIASLFVAKAQTGAQPCAAPTDLNVYAADYGAYSVIETRTYTARGNQLALWVNGQRYINCSNGDSLWGTSNYGITAFCKCIDGGVVPGKVYTVRLRTYCTDQYGLYYDVFGSVEVPQSVDSQCDVYTGGTASTKPKGGGKK